MRFNQVSVIAHQSESISCTSIKIHKPFIPLLILALYLLMPGVGLWLMCYVEEGRFGWVEPRLAWAYLVHGVLVFGSAWYFSTVHVSSLLYRKPVALNFARSSRRLLILMFLVAVILFGLGGVRVLFFGEDRGDLRISFGALGFFYTWLQIYVAPFIIALAASLQLQMGGRVRLRILIIYTLGLIIGIMSGYKFTAILIFLPAFALTIRKIRIFHMIVFFGVALAILMITENMQSGRAPSESLAYLSARSTTIAAYGIIGAWIEFSESGPSFQRILESSFLFFGTKIASFLIGLPEDSVEFLRFNLSRYITYLYYANTEGAVSGTVNLTLTVFGEAVAMFGGACYWIWSLVTGCIVGFVLRAYTRAKAGGDILTANLWLVYFFSVVMSWLNSSGWINLVSLPIIVGMIALRWFVTPIVFITRIR